MKTKTYDDFEDDSIDPDDVPGADTDNTPELVNMRQILRKVLKIVDRKFPQESDCREELYRRRRLASEPICKKCGCKNFRRKPGSLSGKCLSCKTEQSLVIDTPFYKLKKPRAFLSMMILLEEGYAFNSAQFADERDIGDSSSWAMRIKINIAIANTMKYQDNVALVRSEAFASAIGRRSRVTPANEHPIAEERAMREACSAGGNNANTDDEDITETPQQDASSATTDGDDHSGENAKSPKNSKNENAKTGTNLLIEAGANTLNGIQREIYETLTDTPKSLENLIEVLGSSSGELASALTMLELEGFVIRLAGDRYVRDTASDKSDPQQKLLPKQNQMQARPPILPALPTLSNQNGLTIANNADLTPLIEEAIEFIRNVFQGVSRKYLQLYLADFWRVSAHRAGGIPFSIFEACCESLTTGTAEIRAFVTPLMVKMVPAPAS
jgi:biotin operon repressor